MNQKNQTWWIIGRMDVPNAQFGKQLGVTGEDALRSYFKERVAGDAWVVCGEHLNGNTAAMRCGKLFMAVPGTAVPPGLVVPEDPGHLPRSKLYEPIIRPAVPGSSL